MNEFKNVNILVDNESWILPYAERLHEWCLIKGLDSQFCRAQDELEKADVSFFLGCTKLVTRENLSKSKHNLVVHESDLPKGKGFAPMAWQILEGRTEIPICLIEAEESVDSGRVWIKESIHLNGVELCQEWRFFQGEKTVELCKKFLSNYSSLTPQDQQGEESIYPRRTPKDSELDIKKSIEEQFDLLRVVDNKKYPAFFKVRGRKYKLEISQYE